MSYLTKIKEPICKEDEQAYSYLQQRYKQY